MSRTQKKLIAHEFARNDLPRPDVSFLSASIKARYDKLSRALEMHFAGVMPRLIKEELGVSKQTINRLKNRFFSRNENGDLVGWDALLKGKRIIKYTRTKPADISLALEPDGAGFSGALEQSFRQFPKIHKRLVERLRGKNTGAVRSAGLDLKGIHSEWLDDLRAEGVTADRWPFATKGLGYASIVAYASQLRLTSDSARKEKFGPSALDYKDAHSGETSWIRSIFPWDIACYDEQAFPAFGTVVFEEKGQEYEVPAQRCSLCVLVAEGSFAILAYHISYRRRVSAGDFLKTFSNLLTPWQPWTFKEVPNLKYRVGAGMPSSIPGFLQHFRIAVLKVDNDLTHYANVVVEFLRNRLGINLQFGQVARWITRQAVEQTFAMLQQSFSRIPSTTGSGPFDPRVDKPVETAMQYKIRIDALEELAEVVIANLNGTPREALGNATSLEVVHRECARRNKVGSAIPGISNSTRSDLPLPVDICRVTIRGNESKSERPGVHFDGVEYSSDVLRSRWDLCRPKTDAIAYLYQDHRKMRLFHLDGRPIGMVQALGHWGRTYHDRQTRLEIQSLRRERSIDYQRQDDPVLIFRKHLAETMVRSAKSKPQKVSAAANKFMRLDPATRAQTSLPEGTRQSVINPPARPRGAVWRIRHLSEDKR